uniref:Mitotic spindle assembly checkpoint protein MAD2B n=1 Tax=Crassostrea virginica TaxID=6565 RepID=A0A8B8D7P7_CRAVI|nr:uncharacterized protein LOC111124316 [Crassostrea virginica]
MDCIEEDKMSVASDKWSETVYHSNRSGIENRPIFHKTVPRYSQDDSIVSYGHYDPLARKESCVHCCGDREREKNRLTVRSHSQLKNHSRNQHNCTENWNIFIHNSKMVRLIGKLFVIFIFMCLLGFIFGRSSSTIVSDSEKIHLGEEAKLTMHKIQPVKMRVFHQHVKNVSKHHLHDYHDLLRIFFKNPHVSDKEIDLFLQRKTLEDILPDEDYSKRDYSYLNDESYFMPDPLDLADQATQHYAHVLEHPYSSCHEPKPEVIYIPPEGHKKYIPEYTILHRCRNTTGCCWDKSQTCTVKNLEIVTRTFFVVNMLSDDTILPNDAEQLYMENHTSCHCQLLNPHRVVISSVQVHSERFEPETLVHAIALVTDCTVLRLNGEYCVKENRCMKPKCQEGEFDMRKGFCPGTIEPYPHRTRRDVQRQINSLAMARDLYTILIKDLNGMAEADVAQIGVDIFSEFLEIAIHSVLYNRELYPAGVFERRKKYNVPVQICVHPEVNQYITQVVNGISEFNSNKELEKVAIVVLNSELKPLEKFVLEIHKPDISQNQQTDRYLYQLEQSLRSFLLKINMADSLLNPLPRDCTWTVHATTRESAAAQVFDKNVEDNFPWLEASEKETAMDNSSILPLKSTTSPYINMQLYVEETKHFKDS